MRAANMQALTNDVEARYPDVVIYGIGDAAHRLVVSDHNEDDTPGVRAEQSDADNNPEHRAVDIMLGSAFSRPVAENLVARMLEDPATLARLHYIIWDHHIWRADHGWVREDYTGSNPHTDHVHVSGLASDDENTAGWPVVSGATPPAPPAAHVVKRGDSGPEVSHLQGFLRATFPAYRHSVTIRRGLLLTADGVFGPQTEAWVREFQRRTGLATDGIVGPATFAQLRAYGYR